MPLDLHVLKIFLRQARPDLILLVISGHWLFRGTGFSRYWLLPPPRCFEEQSQERTTGWNSEQRMKVNMNACMVHACKRQGQEDRWQFLKPDH